MKVKIAEKYKNSQFDAILLPDLPLIWPSLIPNYDEEFMVMVFGVITGSYLQFDL